MSTHRWCCCGANPPSECAHTCDYGTSYSMAGLTANISWDRTTTGALCGPCTQYDGPAILENRSFSATVTQPNAATLTRYTTASGKCCYRAVGTIRLIWNMGFDYSFRCCAGNASGPICTYGVQDSDTAETDFCLTAVCVPGLWNGADGWQWTLQICSFPLGVYELLDFQQSDCDFGYDCENPPLARRGVIAGGYQFMWKSKHMNPAAIVTITDTQEMGMCALALNCGTYTYPGTDPEATALSCMPTMNLQQAALGPFALVTTTDWGGSPPAICNPTISTGSSYIYGCDGSRVIPEWCTGVIDYASDCCDITMNARFNFPDFT